MDQQIKNLIEKYDSNVPRYTSYPSVPYWDSPPSQQQWLDSVRQAITSNEGIALYIHLPFCQSLCTFCACNKIITKKYELPRQYLDYIVTEFKLYLKFLDCKNIKISELHIGGGSPTFFKHEDLDYLISNILNNVILNKKNHLSFEGDPRNTTKEQLLTMYKLGFNRVSFGIQDYSNKVQKAINRIQPCELVDKVTQQAREIGYNSINYDLIYGLPHQTEDDVKNTFNTVIKQRPNRIAYYSYAHVPWISSTGQRGFSENDLAKGYQKRKLYNIGQEILEQNGYRSIAMDHFALEDDNIFIAAKQNKLFRNFMGYTNLCAMPLIGLGCSSISDSWNIIVQNQKDIKTYIKCIKENKLAINNGHILNNKDLRLRRIIMDLMTKWHSKWNVDYIPDIDLIHNKLNDMIEDKLVTINNNNIKITELGKPFVRNICSTFDNYFQAKNVKRVFSKNI